MPYLPATTIAETLRKIQVKSLILPAIQREYVWKPGQVASLFDSVMRGYPIGGFLSWSVHPDTASSFRFYDFLREYNEFNQRHNPEIDVPPTGLVTAVLDGQQRLTSLNIGLRGTYAWKKRYGWSQYIENYPARTLHLNLRDDAEPNSAGLKYDFRFLSDEQVANMAEMEANSWLPVPLVFNANKINPLLVELSKRGIGNDPNAMERATDLWERVHSEQSVHFYEERDQDVERVLDIFIRVNSAGTVLSYSDLLLSIATAQWTDRDARKEIHGLVDDLNATGAGFRFSKDLILKSGLVLSGINDIAFQVKNFTKENMKLLDKNWDDISASLRVTAGLLSDFGLSGATVTANSVVIPVAMYVHQRGLTQAYRETVAESDDRALVKEWVLRSLVIPGIWGAGLDQLLRSLRSVIQEYGGSKFPSAELEKTMATRGKSLTATPEMIDSLLDLEYKDSITFALLAILFPHVNTRNVHHVDHVFPISKLSRRLLLEEGIDVQGVEEIIAAANRISNLQLLEGNQNLAKSAKLPAIWVTEAFTESAALGAYMDRNSLPELPVELADFLRFYNERRAILRQRLTIVLSPSEATAGVAETQVLPISESVEGSVSEL
ncbi:hypothetical protein GPOL_c01870 [Gordonia polyisoprenivorans VH2]|uniref:GmrSD restriction endonucleases N-terminal domain-containing protein n=1 Tax=Gordonia polyisoprenivorans (strain DSM 44266 / VH2) TaxID=1112204 RepID=H6MRB5_GORPV|nr:DUF262 domain-containing protein [Gordonia polyisoprenivorans]AFA71260.1 hypothetical protein GPOL_c01870 [Gordonia polyisoprenivorans VH2]